MREPALLTPVAAPSGVEAAKRAPGTRAFLGRAPRHGGFAGPFKLAAGIVNRPELAPELVKAGAQALHSSCRVR
eukprot:3235035-Lingulodinium_polyedra.AAC.1